MAAGLARHGLLPVVNSFASFLASRANEQIYNNASERTKVVYALHYAGLDPRRARASRTRACATSRCSERCRTSPSCSPERRGDARAVALGGRGRDENVAIRLAIGPSPRRIELPPASGSSPGAAPCCARATTRSLFAYGPVMLHEALTAAELLAERGVEARVVAMPWLNRFDREWLADDVLGRSPTSSSLEDHAPVGGLGDALRRRRDARRPPR